MWSAFHSYESAERFINHHYDDLIEFFDEPDQIVEYIDPITCKYEDKIMFCILLKFEGGAEYYLREEDTLLITGETVQ